MVGRAKSDLEKRLILRTAKDTLMARAVEAYKSEIDLITGEPRKGLRTICRDFEQLYFNETGKKIVLSHSVLDRLVKGGRTLQEVRDEQCLLKPGEIDLVIGFIIECGNRGFPLSHRRLKEHVDEILKARLGDDFPKGGIGKNWTHRFAVRSASHIRSTWATSLEEKRGQGANPHANTAWWKLLGDTLEEYNIDPKNIYGVDEVGIQPQTGERERVFGSRKKKGPQYQTRAGTKENITVLVTICADGTSQPPAVIFKGSGYQVKWLQNNPLNALIGHQKKGWTDGEIGAEWIKLFDAKTKGKAGNQHRLLLVDGHNSHYTLEFLRQARMNQIVVLCYPAHTTHIYQGLDVVIFSVLKHHLSDARDTWLRDFGKTVNKNNFLEFYSIAHVKALTRDNILSAFKKTGVHPFNPNVITADMMAPAKETSTEGHLPLPPPTPIKAIAKLLQKLSVNDDYMGDIIEERSETNTPIASLPSTPTRISARSNVTALRASSMSTSITPSTSEVPISPSGPVKFKLAFKEAMDAISKSDLAYLTGAADRPVTSNDPFDLSRVNSPIPSTSQAASEVGSIVPKTPTERILFSSLENLKEENAQLRQRVQNLQATNVLNTAYCNVLRFQLATKEENQANKKKKGKLMGDGLPKMLSGDEFYEKVMEFTKWQEEQEQLKADRKNEAVGYKAKLEEWKEREKMRKAANKERSDIYHQALEKWTKRKESAKKCGKLSNFKDKRPKLTDFGESLKAEPRPKRFNVLEDEDGEEFDEIDEESSEEEQNDGDEN